MIGLTDFPTKDDFPKEAVKLFREFKQLEEVGGVLAEAEVILGKFCKRFPERRRLSLFVLGLLLMGT